jgi:hypothetical protein
MTHGQPHKAPPPGAGHPPATLTHRCTACARLTTHEPLALMPHPDDGTKTLCIIRCLECKTPDAIPGPDRNAPLGPPCPREGHPGDSRGPASSMQPLPRVTD